MSDEEYVQSRWELVHCSRQSGIVWVQDVNVHWSDFASWAEAAKFTRQREEAIKDLREEVELLRKVEFPPSHRSLSLPKDRILGRLEAALVELKRRMKQ